MNPLCLKIHIKCSKIDMFHPGCDIYLGIGNSEICSLAAIGSYLRVCREAPASLFLFRDGRPLLRQILAPKVQHILCSAGYSETYSGHSLRIGAATTEASCGVPDHLIKTLGHWSSDAYQVYIRTSVTSIVQVTSQLLQQEVHFGELDSWVRKVSFWAVGLWLFHHEPLCSELHSKIPFSLCRHSWLGCGCCWP